MDSKGRPHPVYQRAGTAPTDPVFPCVPGTDTLGRDLVAAEVERVTHEGKLDFHSLRGAFAVMLEGSGVGLSTAQKLLRHSDPRLTACVYQRLQFTELAEALEAVSETAVALARLVTAKAQP